ncbi:hypothetical protein IV203_015872 [Nitzschia inconspicua]|uniref:Uncharacterized protein n=1 Tax=Nitzschia inconspicua TaxID=303405 RepID=A0A9K3LD41_9STRA|nr:hypothetical protein IV203_015872 [Nitzschia inconspicua]
MEVVAITQDGNQLQLLASTSTAEQPNETRTTRMIGTASIERDSLGNMAVEEEIFHFRTGPTVTATQTTLMRQEPPTPTSTPRGIDPDGDFCDDIRRLELHQRGPLQRQSLWYQDAVPKKRRNWIIHLKEYLGSGGDGGQNLPIRTVPSMDAMMRSLADRLLL